MFTLLRQQSKQLTRSDMINGWVQSPTVTLHLSAVFHAATELLVLIVDDKRVRLLVISK